MSLSNFEKLPAGWQRDQIEKVAPILWSNQEVQAMWIVGSMARGESDIYSDVDLWIAVPPESLAAWESVDLPSIFADDFIAHRLFKLSDEAFLHGVIITGGKPFDLGVQTTTMELSQEPLIPLGSRDDSFSKRLEESSGDKLPPPPASGERVEFAVRNYWINTLKHEKANHRNAEILSVVGLNLERSILMQLWYIAETGYDHSYSMGVTAHGLMLQVRAAERLQGEKAREMIVGGALGDAPSLFKAIEEIRDEVALVGRQLSRQLEFEYPDALEEAVRESWKEFRKTYS